MILKNNPSINYSCKCMIQNTWHLNKNVLQYFNRSMSKVNIGYTKIKTRSVSCFFVKFLSILCLKHVAFIIILQAHPDVTSGALVQLVVYTNVAIQFLNMLPFYGYHDNPNKIKWLYFFFFFFRVQLSSNHILYGVMSGSLSFIFDLLIITKTYIDQSDNSSVCLFWV